MSARGHYRRHSLPFKIQLRRGKIGRREAMKALTCRQISCNSGLHSSIEASWMRKRQQRSVQLNRRGKFRQEQLKLVTDRSFF